MTNALITEIKNLIADFESSPVVKTAETDVEAAGTAAWQYIQTNGLTDLIGIAKGVLLSVATGSPYTAILSEVVTQGEAAGISIAKGAEAIVVAQAQADLIAVGQLVSPSTGATVAPVTVEPATPAA